MLRKQSIIPGLKGGLRERITDITSELSQWIPYLEALSLEDITDTHQSVQPLTLTQALQQIEHEILCVMHFCPQSSLQGQILFDHIKTLVDPDTGNAIHVST